MLLLCLDLARRTGVTYGDSAASAKPRVETWDLCAGRDGPAHFAGTLGYKLRAFMRDNPRPERIVVEELMRPAASKNENATVSQLMLHGAVHAIGGIYRIPVTSVLVNTVRKHFCGRVSALPPKRGRSPREKADAKRQTKLMVLDRAKLLGYLPDGCTDDNQADSVALFEWAIGNVARESPGELRLFT